MKKVVGIWLLCVFASGANVAEVMAADQNAKAAVLYKNATLVHPSRQETTPNAYLYITDGRFNYVGQQRPRVPAGTEVIDLESRYVTPGFVDTHAHIGLGAVSFSIEGDAVVLHAENQREIAEWNARKMLEVGVTSMRNPGGDTRANLEYRDAQRNEDLSGPRAYVAGSIINNEAFSGLAISVDDEATITHAVEYQAQRGVDFIKLYTGLNEQQVSIAVREAQRWELPVIGHLESLSWQRGAELGIDHLVHAMPVSPDLLPDDTRDGYLATGRPGAFSFFEWYAAADLNSAEVTAMIETLHARQTSVDPTLIVFYNAFFGDQASVTEHPRMVDTHPKLIENWRTFYHFNLGWSPDDFALAQATWPKVLSFVKQLYDAGILLTVGTDLGNPWVIPGFSYFQEMRLLEQAGIPAFEVLRLATSNGAKVLGQDHELGQLAPGYIADFAVFRANPAEDLRHLSSIERVVQGGTLRVQH